MKKEPSTGEEDKTKDKRKDKYKGKDIYADTRGSNSSNRTKHSSIAPAPVALKTAG